MKFVFPDFNKLVRYYGVGIFSNCSAYMVFASIVYLSGSFFVAVTVSFLVGHGISFVFNRFFVFKSVAHLGKSVLVSFLAAGSAYAINITAIYYLSNIQGFSPYYVQAIVLIFVSIFLFFINDIFVHVGKT